MDLGGRQSSFSSKSLISRSLPWRDVGTETSDVPKGPFGLSSLSSPENAIADLVFVHGLGGGSRSTWTKGGDPALYWPKEWLPMEVAFYDVRIHSFGYNSNWDKESVLNIHDFAKALLGEIKDCPSIPNHSKVRLLFIFVMPIEKPSWASVQKATPQERLEMFNQRCMH